MRPKKTVLLVDDDEIALSVRRFLFETCGFRVVTAASGAEALQLLTQSGYGALDLMICELSMREMLGSELASKAKCLRPEMRVMLSARRNERIPVSMPDAWDLFLPSMTPNADVIERARILTARKRGPKPLAAPVPVAAMQGCG